MGLVVLAWQCRIPCSLDRPGLLQAQDGSSMRLAERLLWSCASWQVLRRLLGVLASSWGHCFWDWQAGEGGGKEGKSMQLQWRGLQLGAAGSSALHSCDTGPAFMETSTTHEKILPSECLPKTMEIAQLAARGSCVNRLVHCLVWDRYSIQWRFCGLKAFVLTQALSLGPLCVDLGSGLSALGLTCAFFRLLLL